MNPIQQSLCNTDYYYCQPVNVRRFMIINCYNKLNCPFYAPVVKDGVCRLCHNNSMNHRKYYIYSNFARKIQNVYLNRKFNKFFKQNINLFKNLNKTSLPYFALVFKFKILYHRRWTKYNLLNFLNRW